MSKDEKPKPAPQKPEIRPTRDLRSADTRGLQRGVLRGWPRRQGV